MAKYKYIYWRSDISPSDEGEMFANVHLLIGYNLGSLTDFRQMANELRETFPQATEDEIYCGKVYNSVNCKGFTVITWSVYLPKSEYPDWQQVDGQPEYDWL